jgi:hypothetical protein
VAHPQIAVFARLAKGRDAPKRLIAGQDTKLSRTMHDIRYDEVHDEFIVTNPFAEAILVFAGNASGNQPPLRIIQGPHTRMTGADRVEVDPIHDEIFVPAASEVLVFPRTANGDVAPIRVIQGPDTKLRRGSAAAAVDPVHNLLVVGTGGTARRGAAGLGSLLIFNRTDDGNAKPLRIIQGPKSGIIRINQMAVYPPRKLVVATQPGEADAMEPEGAYIGIWSLDDTGDVPPKWRINASAKSAMIKARGVTLDPRNKELIVADMRLNAVLTYYFPEMF